ncbi:MAG: glycoside hydrolase family 99-like domain-containing protein [Monoglobaceae bacterium]
MKNIKKYAWYFPNWHPTPLNDKWHGKNWTEWEVLKYAHPRFEGHISPRLPLWGFENEADPAVMERKIQTAHDYGIDGFIFDFYWFKDRGPYRRECLDEGFLKAKNNELCEFSVMWCNHDAANLHPASYLNENIKLASGDIDAEFFYEVTDFCIKNYFTKPNYQRIDGKLYFGFWDLTRLLNNFGGIHGLFVALRDFRRRAKQAGFELHIAVNKNLIPGYRNREKEKLNKILRELEIDSVFSYFPNMGVCKKWPTIDYADYIDSTAAEYKSATELIDIPFDITVSNGWDSSSRTVQTDKYEEGCGYPFNPIVVGDTPENVGKGFERARQFIESGDFTGNMLLISTWNEWTEGNNFEPDELYGYSYLEELKRVFG